MYELWQTEWCPASRRVRQRLTELGVDHITRQVPVEKDERALLRERTGTDTIPVLIAPDGEILIGEELILSHLDDHELVPAEARAHRLKPRRFPRDAGVPLPRAALRRRGRWLASELLTSAELLGVSLGHLALVRGKCSQNLPFLPLRHIEEVK